MHASRDVTLQSAAGNRSDTLRIVHVSAYFAPAYGFGGPPRSLLATCRAQRHAGLDVEVFTTTANRGEALPACPDGVEIEGVRVRSFPLSAPAALLGAASMRDPLTRAARESDVVHLHGLFNRTIWMASAAARRAGTPTVVSPRGMLEAPALAHHGWRKRASWALVDREVARAADAWHATSPAEAASLSRRWPRATVIEIPNAVDAVHGTESDRCAARAVAGVPPGSPYVLFLGRLHPLKRLDLLAAAFSEVVRRRAGVHLVIAGPDEAGYRTSVEPLFAAAAARVHWCGQVDGALKAGLLAGASALVMCSDSESFGMSVAEALAAAVPVVVTRSCPWPALDTEGGGYWVDQRADAIAAGLVRLLSDADAAGELGRRGRAYVLREFSAPALGARWCRFYRDLRRSVRAAETA
jgi:glycosyltransferase involved in cell wall biosynthesis